MPLTVTGITPENGAADVATSAPVIVTFSEAVDPESILAGGFSINAGQSILAAAVSMSADGTAATLTPSSPLPAATVIDVAVSTGVRDTAGNPMTTPFNSRFTTSGTPIGPGVLLGEVYDDARGLPLAGATVEALALDTRDPVVNAQSDERGRFVLEPGQTEVLVRVSAPGHSTVERLPSGALGTFEELLDVRLTPIADAQPVSVVLGSELESSTGQRLAILPGAVAENTEVAFTPISPQGPRLPFPPGWTPLAIVEIDTPHPFDPLAEWVIEQAPQGAIGRTAVAAHYDAGTAAWVAEAVVDIAEDGRIAYPGIAGSGQYAILLADAELAELQNPVPGQPLAHGDAIPIPVQATASGEVTPSVGRADDPTPAGAHITIDSNSALRSGTPIRGDFMELILLRDGGQVAPLDTLQDFIAYRSPAEPIDSTLTADFPIAPSRLFGPTEVSEGTITVTLRRRESAGRELIGLAGGGLQIDDGSRVMVPAGSLPDDVPLDLRRVDAAAFPTDADSGLTFIGGLELDLSGAAANNPLTLSLAGAAALAPTGSRVVVAEVREVLGRQRLVLVALARIDGDALTTIAEFDGITLPGIRAGGRYGFFRFDGALAAVGGSARDEAGRRDGHAVAIEGLALVSITDAAGAFALLSPLGSYTLVATAAEFGDQAVVQGDTDTALAEIIIGPTPPRAETVTVRPPMLEGNFAGPIRLLGDPAPVIDDDEDGASLGNGDGRVDAGEKIELSLAVRNDGTIPVEDGFFALRIQRPSGLIEVEPEAIPLEALPPDAPLTVGPFVFVAPPDIDRHCFATR